LLSGEFIRWENIMKFFLDTADINEIREAQETGLLDGITTNPSHVAKANRNFVDLVKEICEIVQGPVSAEVTADAKDEMLRQGRFLADLAPNVVVKVPLTQEGLKAVKVFTEEGIKTNVTLCFSSVQALLAAKVGATYISPFVGRIDDLGNEGMGTIREIRKIYDNYGFATQILTASTRSALHIQEAAMAGSDVATMPMALFKKLVNNPLTEIGLKLFDTDWNKIPAEFRTY
jgi:transaldolase